MEDDLQSIYDQPGMQMQEAPQTMPVSDVEFTEADGQQLRGLQNGLARLDQKEYTGEIPTEKAREIKQQVSPRLGQLKQKQQVAQQQQQTRLQHAAMQQSAAQESINQVHLKARAEGFPQTVATLVHEMSGHIAHFFQDKLGSWSQVDWSKAAPEQTETASGGDTAENYFPGAQPGLGMGVSEPGEDSGAITMDGKTYFTGAAHGSSSDNLRAVQGEDGKTYFVPDTPHTPAVKGPLIQATGDVKPAPTMTPAADQSEDLPGQHGDYSLTQPNPAPQEAPAQQTSAATPPRHVMTIQNGSHIQKFGFNLDGTMEKVADNHPDWTEVGHSGVQTGEVEVAYGQAAKALAAQGFHAPKVVTSGPPAVVAQSMRMQDAYMNRVSSVAQNILNRETKSKQSGQTQENMLARIKASNDAKDARQEKQLKARSDFHQNYLNHGNYLKGKDVNGNPVLATPADIVKSMQAEQEAYHTLHGQGPSQTAAPQGSSMAPSAQDFINSQLK